MSLPTLLSALSLFVIGGLALRHERHWVWLLLFVAGALGATISLIKFGMTGTIWWAKADLLDIYLVPATVALAGLARTRIRQAKALAFDRQLWIAVDELNRVLEEGYPANADADSVRAWSVQAVPRAEAVVARMASLRPPDSVRRLALERYVNLAERKVAFIPTGVSEEERRQLIELGKEAVATYELLPERKRRPVSKDSPIG